MRNLNIKLIRIFAKIANKIGLSNEEFLDAMDMTEKEKRILEIILED